MKSMKFGRLMRKMTAAVLLFTLLLGTMVTANAADPVKSSKVSKPTFYEDGCLKTLTLTIQSDAAYDNIYGKVAIHKDTPKSDADDVYSTDGSEWPSSFKSDSTLVTISKKEFTWADGESHAVTLTFPEDALQCHADGEYTLYLWTRDTDKGVYADTKLTTLKTSANGTITIGKTVYSAHVGELTEAVDATAAEAGNSAYYTCTVCGKYFSDSGCTNEIDADSWVIPAAGETEEPADIQPEEPEASEAEAAEQNADPDAVKTEAKDATCTEAGNIEYYTKDGVNYSDEDCTTVVTDVTTPALGHNLTATAAKAATCTDAGNSAYWHCSRCDKYFSDEACTTEIEKDSWVIPAAHTPVLTEAKAATCTKAGSSAYYTCSVCGKYFSDEACTTEIEKDSWVIDALGHDAEEHAAVAATCTEAGSSAYYECSVCHEYFSDEACTKEIALKDTVVPAKGHTLTAVAAKDATCTEEGNTAYYECSVCGKYFSDKDGTKEIEEDSWVIDALGHYGGQSNGLTVAKAATCGEDGNPQYYTCERCGCYFSDKNFENEIDEEDTVIPATGKHTPVLTPASAATCIKAGNKAYYTCSVCGEYFSDEACTKEIEKDSWVIAAAGHKYPANWTVVKAATATETGLQQKVCTVCGNKLQQTIPVTGQISSARTGDESCLWLWAAAAVVSAGCLGALAVVKLKRGKR